MMLRGNHRVNGRGVTMARTEGGDNQQYCGHDGEFLV